MGLIKKMKGFAFLFLTIAALLCVVYYLYDKLTSLEAQVNVTTDDSQASLVEGRAAKTLVDELNTRVVSLEEKILILEESGA